MTDKTPASPAKGPRSVALLLSLALLVGGLGILAAVVHFTMPRGGQLASSPSAIGGAFALTDQTGKAVSEKDLMGKPSLVFFGFTHCPDICPTKLFEITQMLDQLGTDAAKVNVVFITVDPARDTAELLSTYLGSFHAGIRGFTGTEEQVTAAMRAYRAYARKVPLTPAATRWTTRPSCTSWTGAASSSRPSMSPATRRKPPRTCAATSDRAAPDTVPPSFVMRRRIT